MKKKRTPTRHSAIQRDLMSPKYRQRIKPNKKKLAEKTRRRERDEWVIKNVREHFETLFNTC